MDNRDIKDFFEDASRLFTECAEKNALLLEKIAREMISCFEQGNKVLIFGNGGSASQAQHFAAELVNKMISYRQALPAVSLTADTSILTSVGNDLDFCEIFSRQVEALGNEGDIAWGLSTSGASSNVIQALNAAGKRRVRTICFTGREGSELSKIADMALTVPSDDTARIQEVHLCSGHAVCGLVEAYYLSKIENK